jgi:hypothetical protein
MYKEDKLKRVLGTLEADIDHVETGIKWYRKFYTDTLYNKELGRLSGLKDALSLIKEVFEIKD